MGKSKVIPETEIFQTVDFNNAPTRSFRMNYIKKSSVQIIRLKTLQKNQGK
jgi:hypothetical protein